MAVKPRCFNCRHYQPSPLHGQGWCRNPLLYHERERSLVEANKLSCDKRFYNYWEPRDGDEPLPPRTPPRFTLAQKLPSLNPGQAVYYYAIAIILVLLGIGLVLILPTAGSPAASAGQAAATGAAGTGTAAAAGTAAAGAGAPAPGATRAPATVRVGNTGGDGACIRQDPSRGAKCLAAKPDGSALKIAGADTQAEGRVWRYVDDEKGTSGWVPAEYLIVDTATPSAGR
jgi:hypothetical protein